MREELRGRIRRNYIELIQSSSLYEATDEFLSNGDITTADAETVELERTTQTKNKALLQILQMKPDGLYEKILRLLFREGHRELVEKLTKDLYDTTDLQQESMFTTIFSSPEPSGSQGELIVYPCSVVRPSVVRRPPFSKIFFSETAWPIKAKFYMKHLWEGGTNVYINNPGHMTKMAAMPIYGKNPSKIFFSRTTGPISTKLGMKHR